MSVKTPILVATAALGLASAPAFAAEAEAIVHDQDGDPIGTVTARDTPSGRVVLTIILEGLPAGLRAVHLHETGDCSAPDFTSAGGHIADGATHGVDTASGPHPGDLPNVYVHRGRSVRVQYFLTDLDVQRDLLDPDGAAFIVHQHADDYVTDLTGDAGMRRACGEFVVR
jgi:Cu-Zn family superoxide dismutase